MKTFFIFIATVVALIFMVYSLGSFIDTLLRNPESLSLSSFATTIFWIAVWAYMNKYLLEYRGIKVKTRIFLLGILLVLATFIGAQIVISIFAS
ncbi:hypothetical protein Ferp_0634 [Ferroglobus placidus DSM 10642]|uniref:Uncharacterized protein n=1 Tax=Ferroglobus placidus (strain DSM 10642 / AEDII12DO) TaxID=589924 RepID=D3S3H2_FERPA|nr:hypothetical protein Ferp_0634 [Ferroglobus placidus DSM 10642]